MKAQRALLSVSDKTGIVDFARALAARGIELVSTGGTYSLLAKEGVPVIEIRDYTGFPEILDGRLKTLHPLVHGGLLAVRDDATHKTEMEANGIKPIDLVVVNLYPFEATVAKPGVSLAEAIENIDIGGPTMLRSAAKNNAYVAAVVDPADYAVVLAELAAAGEVSAATRFTLARKVFDHTARYDALISNYLGSRERDFPVQLNLTFVEQQGLRYGENPHQKAHFYRDAKPAAHCTAANLEQLQGKELSYNNILDLSAALDLCREFASDTFVCILKHTNPCGAALGTDVTDAFKRAWATDPASAFGGIIGSTVAVDGPAAEAMTANFMEIVVAPAFTPEALAVFAKKPNVRVMRMTLPLVPCVPGLELRRVSGGLLVQEADWFPDGEERTVVTKAAPADTERVTLEFAWKLCKHVKSNAIVYAAEGRLVGVGAGQMSRVDSARIGAEKAQSPLAGCVLASDAFFPFRDGVDAAAAHGVTAIIQPGGSVRDQEVIDACDGHGISMVFTGRRHFRH